MDWSNLTEDQVDKLSDMVFLAYEEGFIDAGGEPFPDKAITRYWGESLTKNKDLCVLCERFQEKDS